MTQVLLRAGKRMLPVLVGRQGKKIRLEFRLNHDLKEDIKTFVGAEFTREGGPAWLVTDCERNRIQLEILEGKEPKAFARYRAPLPEEKPTRKVLRDHQVDLFRFGIGRRRCIFAADPGTGKTLAAMEVMEWAARHGFSDWWWVGPTSALEATKLELEKWKCSVQPKFVGYHMLVKELEAKFRCAACGEVNCESRVTKTTVHEAGEEVGKTGVKAAEPWEETFRRCPECDGRSLKKLPDPPAPHGVIFDESAALMSMSSQWTKAALVLSEAIREEHDGFAIEMSGLCDPHDPTNWWSQAEIACPGWLRESSAKHLERRVAIIEMQEGFEGKTFPKILGYKDDEVKCLARRLEGLVRVWRADDCLDLPPLTFERIRLEPSPAIIKAAKLILATATNGAQVLNKLRQLSDGFQYQEDGPPRRAPCPKDDALKNLLERSEETGRIIIYGGYAESIDRCVDVCLANGWDVLRRDGDGRRVEAKGKWRQFKVSKKGKDYIHTSEPSSEWLREMDPGTRTGKKRLAYVAHPKAGGVGLNLHAARVEVYYSSDFDYGAREQSIKRAHRMGQAHGVTVYDLCHLKTDEYILDNLEKKRSMHNVTVAEIREALS